ncbi:amidase [Xylogone sp. PMI_703]|nr:amidase [Xylogone sp. PMI_703]
MTEPYRITASEASKLIRDGKLSVEDYAKSLLSRIKERDHVVKAWAYLNPDLVLAEARKLDQIPPANRGPLHGIPVGIKDVFLTKDMPTECNSAIYKGASPSGVDASAIITLRAAGALIFGKTTTTEFAAVTDGGPCTNPHDSNRTPGGSSSGSAAAVGDFQLPVALGTQTGGSTVRPGSFNGVYAFKPTWGAISREGFAQYSITCDTIGFFGRCVEDLELFANVYQLQDDAAVPPRPFSVKGARIAFCKTPIWHKAGPGTRAAFLKAQELLKSAGANVEELELPDDFSKISGWHTSVLAGEGRASFLGNYLLAKDKLNGFLHGHAENRTKLTRKAQLEAYDGCARLRPVWDSIASQYDAVIVPSVVDEAPVGIGNTGDASFCSIWTILHAPVINIPGFAGENDLPIGLTVVGARYNDLHVLHAGKGIGEVFEAQGGFRHKLF